MPLRLLLAFTLVAGQVAAKDPPDRPDGPPVVTAKAWVVADGATGQVLHGANAAEPRPMASTTKIMTAWVVLRLAADDPKLLDQTVTFSERAAKTQGSSARLQAGEKVTVRNLLYGLLLPSGNDAAVALAEHFGPRLEGDENDPVGRFVAHMNQQARALGLGETSYADPNGLSRDNRSSARDLAALAAVALQDDLFRKYVATARHTCKVTTPDGQPRDATWNNTNKLLDIEGYDGVKTGTTTPAGNCLVATARRDGRHLLVVVLGSTSTDGRYADARNLFRWAWRERPSPAPPGPLAGAVLVVDPGHGGQRYSKSYTGGTRGVVTRQTESELNLRLAVELVKCLREKGATVHLTRDADHRLSPEGSSNRDELHARIDFFEHHNCHFFLSVHHNAGPPTATGHTALYKHNAPDDTLYESLARTVNDALAGAVPGPKRNLIKGSYHILRETDIPGTISEAGFLTNREFDELSSRPDFPKKEAEAICKAAVRYWTAHRPALVALRDKLTRERAARPRDPSTYTATALNPAYQARMKELLAQVAPDGKHDPARVADYIAAFQRVVVTDRKATFNVTATRDGNAFRLSGEVSDRLHHDRLIDLLVAMRLFPTANEIRLPKTPKK